MTWQTTPEEFTLAVEEADTVLRSNGISQTQRTHVRRLLESVYAEYGEAFGSVPFCLACKKQAKRVFVLLHLQCDSHSPRCTGEDQGNGVSAPVWRFQQGINTVSISLETVSLDWKSLRAMLAYMGEDRRTFRRAALFRFLTMGLAVLEPILSAKIITALSASQLEKIFLFSVLILARTVLSSILTYFASKMLRQSYSAMIRNMRIDMTESVLSITTACMDDNSSGVFTQRLINETDNCADNLDELLGDLTEIFRLISLLISFGIVDPRILLFEIILFSVYVIIQRAQTRSLTNDGRKVRTANENQTGFVGEMVRAHRDIKLLHCEESFLVRLKSSIEITLDLILKMRVKSMRYILVRSQFSGYADFIFMAILAVMLAQGNMEPATALVLYSYNSQMTGSCVQSVSSIMSTIFSLGLSAERIWQLMYSSDFEKETFGETVLPQVRGDLEIRDVSFAYTHSENRVPVLNHLNLKISAGESVAFVGKSGCGKSTVLSLLTRLYDPEEGQILLDGVPLPDLTRDTLRGNMTMVSQSPYIFNMSIRDNLRVVDAELPEEEMIRVCKIACIHDDIMRFPLGYDTVVGESGVTLSGGQRQRLALARSMLRNSPVILLDEATSALDNETQEEIHQAIENMRGDHTLIMVAHRLSTVIGCDRLFLIEGGQVAAEGTHKQLLDSCESYRNLYRTETDQEVNPA